MLVIKDETLGPVHYAEKLYKKAAKHRRAVEQLQPLLDEAISQLEYVEDVAINISQLDRCDFTLVTFACQDQVYTLLLILLCGT